MARPKKENLEYFPFDNIFFCDRRIKRLNANLGSDGICIYLFILCEIYRNSYFVTLDEDFLFDIAEYFRITEQRAGEIIDGLIERSLLVSVTLDSQTVLTSQDVQSRYQEAKKGAKRDIAVDKRIWLLPPEETKPFIKTDSRDADTGKNKSFSPKNEGESGKNPTKEKKGKERKEKEKKEKVSVSAACLTIPCENGSFGVTKELLDELTHTYPHMDVQASLQKLCVYLQANPHKQGTVSTMEAYLRMWLSDDDQKGKYRSETYTPSYDIAEYESQSIIDEGLDFLMQEMRNTS